LALAVAVALVARLAFVFFTDLKPEWDGAIYVQIAEQLLKDGTYATRVVDDHHNTWMRPTAFYPVGFPAVIALTKVLFGSTRAVLYVQAVAGALLVPLAFLLSRRLYGLRTANIAAFSTALWPGGILLSGSYLAEPLTALGIGLAAVILSYAHPQRRTLWRIVIAGVLLGVTAYVRSTSLAVALTMGFCFGWVHRQRKALSQRIASAIAYSALLLAVAFLPLVPWMVRNARALGSPVPVSTNGGINLLIGALNDEGGFQELPREYTCAALNELASDRCYTQHAMRVIRESPLTWLGLGVLKVVHTFAHESAPAQYINKASQVGTEVTLSKAVLTWALSLCRLYWVVVGSCALIAIAYTLRRKRTSTALAAVIGPILGLGTLHFVYIGGDRYHGAVFPMIAALAAFAMCGAKVHEPSDASAHQMCR